MLNQHIEAETNGRHFPDDIFKCIFMNENVLIAIKISLKFVPKGQINNIPVLVQIMAWRRSGDKPLSEPRMESLRTHICVTWPQWVNFEKHKIIVAVSINSQNWGVWWNFSSWKTMTCLTHRGWVRYICFDSRTISGLDNGLAPGRHQAITWTNAGILLIGPLGTKLNEILIKIHTFSFKKMHLKMSSGKCWPFCFGLNVLTCIGNTLVAWCPVDIKPMISATMVFTEFCRNISVMSRERLINEDLVVYCTLRTHHLTPKLN